MQLLQQTVVATGTGYIKYLYIYLTASVRLMHEKPTSASNLTPLQSAVCLFFSLHMTKTKIVDLAYEFI